MVFVTAALLLLLGIAAAAVGAEVVRRLETSRLAVLPVPSGLLAPDPVPSAPAMPGAGAWELASLGELAGLDFAPTAMARSDRGWVAVGPGDCRDAGAGQAYDCMLLVAVSPDGLRWERVAGTTPLILGWVPPSSGPVAGMSDVAAGADGYVAVGFGSGDLGPGNAGRGVEGTAWWSPDGRTWEAQRLGAGARPATVFRAGDRWLIGGVVYRDAGPVGAIWTSTDGHTWTLVDDPVTLGVGGYVDTGEDPASGGVGSFAASGGVIVAGGQVCAEGGRPCTAAAWRSADGLAWERVGALPAGEWVTGLEATGSGFVAAVAVCGDGSQPCSTLLLRSPDGRAWEPGPVTLPERVGLAAVDGTFVMVAGEYGDLAVGVSTDGAAWTDLGPVAVSSQVSWGNPVLVARGNGGVMLVARSNVGEDGPLMAWEIAPAR
jgi:hypothetical protein